MFYGAISVANLTNRLLDVLAKLQAFLQNYVIV